MRRPIHSLVQRFRSSRLERHKRRRGPELEGLEQRSLLSVSVPDRTAAHHDTVRLDVRTPKAHKGYVVTNLVENTSATVSGSAPQLVDSSLINSWGMSFSATSPFWISDEGTGIATIYTVSQTNTVTKDTPPSPVSVPSATGAGSPTGQVFNGTSGFNLPTSSGGTVPSDFIFDTLQGTIDGWNPGSTGGAGSAVVEDTFPSATFTGLAMGTSGGQTYLYAANDAASPGIDVVNSTTWTPVALTGNFVDPKLKAGYVPYNIQNVNGELYVTYRSSTSSTAGGAVAEFNSNGTFVRQIAINRRAGNLQAPWGVTLAPAGFGKFGGDLLVGNFGSGKIDVYNIAPKKPHFVGTLTDTHGKALVIPGLWALDFGNGGKAGLTSDLYFTAGIDGQAGGLFGAIQTASSAG
jgi:uncharacterized protein (TIGR03118 family)